MNFNFGYSQRKPLGFPLNLRQFSTFGVHPTKVDSLVIKTSQFGVLNTPIISNKCFSNPNFVNKNHPNILAPSVAGIVKFDSVPTNFCVQQPKCDSNVIKNETGRQKLPEKSSQEGNKVEIVKTSPKMSKRNKRKKKKQPKLSNKGKSNKKCGNSKKSKPWHKYNEDLEVIDFSESTLDSDCSNMTDEAIQPYCITINPKTPAMDIKSDPRIVNIEKSDSSMSVSPCHHEILKTLRGNFCKLDLVPQCSPIVKKLRMPSECESEDSFIVFEDRSSDSEEISSEDDSDFEEDTDESDCDVEFSDNCDSRNNRRKVSYFFYCSLVVSREAYVKPFFCSSKFFKHHV